MAQRLVPVDVRLAVALARRVAGERVNVTALAASLGISRQQFYVFEQRYRQGGLEAVLEPRSRRPRTNSAAIPVWVEDLIVLIRKELAGDGWDNGADSIRPRLAVQMAADPRGHDLPVPSRASVNRVLQRRGQVVPAPRKRPRPPSRRFEYPNPNSCWQVDATAWCLADGSGASIVQVIDDSSRKLMAHHVAEQETSASVWQALSTAIEQHGIPRQVLTDQGAAMLGWGRIVTQVRHNLQALGVKCVTSRGYHPQTCGKNERVHQTLQRWLHVRPAAQTLAELQQLCDDFQDAYNTQRPHQALAGLTPDARYALLPKAGPDQSLTPPPATIVRYQVSSRGIVVVHNQDRQSFHLGLGRQWEGCHVMAITQQLRAAVFYDHQLIAEFHLDPTKLYQGSGAPNNASRRTRKPRIKDTGLSAMS